MKCVYEWGIPRTWPRDSVHLRPASALGDTPFRFDDFRGVANTVCRSNCHLKFSRAARFTFVASLPTFTKRTKKIRSTEFNVPRTCPVLGNTNSRKNVTRENIPRDKITKGIKVLNKSSRCEKQIWQNDVLLRQLDDRILSRKSLEILIEVANYSYMSEIII